MFEYNESDSKTVFVLIKNATQNSMKNLTENVMKINTKISEILIDLFDVSNTTNKNDE